MHLTERELRHIVWEQLGVRVAPNTPERQMLDLLSYKVSVRDLPPNPVNLLRDEVVRYIRDNQNRLSLPCDGDCYQHPDGMVLHCHTILKEE
ncbi:MAG: hypothetical protein HN396_18205 [Gemmatimonadales bacterium]|nr:hypothetical protein [Gemmatimonadales bacterium]